MCGLSEPVYGVYGLAFSIFIHVVMNEKETNQSEHMQPKDLQKKLNEINAKYEKVYAALDKLELPEIAHQEFRKVLDIQKQAAWKKVTDGVFNQALVTDSDAVFNAGDNNPAA